MLVGWAKVLVREIDRERGLYNLIDSESKANSTEGSKPPDNDNSGKGKGCHRGQPLGKAGSR